MSNTELINATHSKLMKVAVYVSSLLELINYWDDLSLGDKNTVNDMLSNSMTTLRYVKDDLFPDTKYMEGLSLSSGALQKIVGEAPLQVKPSPNTYDDMAHKLENMAAILDEAPDAGGELSPRELRHRMKLIRDMMKTIVSGSINSTFGRDLGLIKEEE